MIDSLEYLRTDIEADGTRQELGMTPGDYGIITLHRPANVDHPDVLTRIVEGLCACAKRLPLVFPVHPRTRKALESHGLMSTLEGSGARILSPLGYVPFLNLVFGARLVITDSGGIQEETTYLGIPCLTLRPNTERPVTIREGTNRLVTPDDLIEAVDAALNGEMTRRRPPEFWDGRTAQRVVGDIANRFGR